MNAYIKAITRFLLLLLAIQLIRALMIAGLWTVFHPAPASVDWAYMDMIVLSLIGMGLISFFRPQPGQLSLDWSAASRWERAIYIEMGILVIGLVLATYFLQRDVFIINISTVLVLPIFEELLFRGWGWAQLEQAASGTAQFIHWLVTSILFGIWHLGYMDIYLLKVAPAFPDMQWGTFLLMKLTTTFVIGLLVGLPRWRTGRVQGAIVLHALINLFGR